MNVQELQGIVSFIDQATNNGQQKFAELHAYKEWLRAILFPPDPAILPTLFPNDAAVDAFVAAQSPIYNSKLAAIEEATDILGTDVFH